MELDDVVLYQDDSGNSAMMSERVSGLASSIYREFERLIERYDEDVVKELMPLVVAVLENLDSACAVNQEHEVELELLKEDNEQLMTQYEREKALRKHAEERYIALEDSQDGEKKDLQCRLLMLESHTRQVELKIKNYADQISRFEEREAELKKEYNTLHQRHTEMIHNYMEHLERSKHQHTAAAAEPTDAGANISVRIRKERPVSVGLYQLPGSDGVTPELHREPVDTPSEPWRFNNLSHPRSNTSLKDELSSVNRGGSKSSTPTKGGTPQSSQPKTNSLMSSQGVTSNSDAQSSNSQAATPLSPADGESAGDSPASTGVTPRTPASTAASDVNVESVVDLATKGQVSDGFNQNLDSSSDKPESSKDLLTVQEVEEASPPHKDGDGLEKSEVQAIIESTPELDMDLSSCRGTSTPTKGGIENMAFDRNTDSLFEELSSAGNDLIGDVDEGADLLGMGREVEHLIHENSQLLETKNALNVVKNDLIARIDELSCEKEGLRGELDAVTQAKTKLEEKNKELEEELKKIRAELEDSKQKVKSNDNEDDSDVPTAQRKRFTRVEMARVLMERNQYKERLMELQEAIKWTEMIRASKESPALQEKKKSSLWQL